jgi:hypothetical protein
MVQLILNGGDCDGAKDVIERQRAAWQRSLLEPGRPTAIHDVNTQSQPYRQASPLPPAPTSIESWVILCMSTAVAALAAGRGGHTS